MPASSSQHPGGMSDDELNAYWDAAMRIPDTHNYASLRGPGPDCRPGRCWYPCFNLDCPLMHQEEVTDGLGDGEVIVERNIYCTCPMRAERDASLRGRFPALRGYMRPWRRLVRSWAARAYSAAICGGQMKRWEDAK